MKLIFLCFTCLTFFCDFLYCTDAEKQKNIIIKSIIKKIANDRLKLIGVGGSGTREGLITNIALSFQIQEHLSIDDARVMVLTIAKTMLEVINDSEKIRPYLGIYPFRYNDIEAAVFTLDYDGRTNVDPYVASVGLYNCRLMFLTNDPEDCLKIKREIFENLQAEHD